MKIIKISKLIPLSISVAAIALTSASWAAGTAAGTTINNTATIAYQVGGVAQTEIGSSALGNSSGAGTPTTFVVDKKIDLLVTAGAGTPVAPGASGTATNLSFTLKNEGNSTESFSLTASQVAAGDDFDTSNCTVTSPASPVSLAADDVTDVTVQCDIPANNGTTVINASESKVNLLAAESTGLSETNGADTVGSVDIVFADGAGASDMARDAKHSAINTYTINTADLTVMKTSAVTEMVILKDDGTTLETVTTNAKRIPGATIVYTITVSNKAGASTATGIVITDTVPADLTVSTSTPPTISGGTSTTASASGNDVTTAAFDLPAGQTATLTITATVN